MAFTEAFGLSALIAMGVAVTGAILVRLFLPAQHLENEEVAASPVGEKEVAGD